MIMISKYSGKCVKCGNLIAVGTRVEWTRGVGVMHLPGLCGPKVAAPAARPVVTLDPSKIVAFLHGAQARGLKFPKARFLGPENRELRLSLAGDTSAYPGAVQVKLDDQWIGRINVDGTVAGCRDAAIVAALTTVATDAAKAAREYGALMGRCSFCNLKLTDAGSTEVGYGPVCAEKFGLPHHPKGTPTLTKEVPAA